MFANSHCLMDNVGQVQVMRQWPGVSQREHPVPGVSVFGRVEHSRNITKYAFITLRMSRTARALGSVPYRSYQSTGCRPAKLYTCTKRVPRSGPERCDVSRHAVIGGRCLSSTPMCPSRSQAQQAAVSLSCCLHCQLGCGASATHSSSRQRVPATLPGPIGRCGRAQPFKGACGTGTHCTAPCAPIAFATSGC